MSLLFSVDQNRKVLLHPEVIKLCPSLATLSEEELLFVIMYMDYSSPFRQQPDHERKRRAIEYAFSEEDPKVVESEGLKIAMIDYNSLQYSPKVEAARQFQKKIDSLLLILQEDTSPSNIKKTVDAIDLLRKNIMTYEQEYEDDVQKRGVLKGKMTMSWLEEIMANQKRFKAVTAKK